MSDTNKQAEQLLQKIKTPETRDNFLSRKQLDEELQEIEARAKKREEDRKRREEQRRLEELRDQEEAKAREEERRKRSEQRKLELQKAEMELNKRDEERRRRRDALLSISTPSPSPSPGSSPSTSPPPSVINPNNLGGTKVTEPPLSPTFERKGESSDEDEARKQRRAKFQLMNRKTEEGVSGDVITLQREKEREERRKKAEEQRKKEEEEFNRKQQERLKQREERKRLFEEEKKRQEDEIAQRALQRKQRKEDALQNDLAALQASTSQLVSTRASLKEKRAQNLAKFNSLLEKNPQASNPLSPSTGRKDQHLARNTTMPLPKFQGGKIGTDDRVRKDVPKPVGTVLEEGLLFDWASLPVIDSLRSHLFREGRLSLNAAKRLLQNAIAHFSSLPNLLTLQAPLLIVGDLHGQFYDTLNLIKKGGDPSKTSYLFLGDYVDRGSFGCEICFYLFGLALRYPKTFHLLRGNHESRSMTNSFDFHLECQRKYNEEIYQLMLKCFDSLPLAATVQVKDDPNSTYFCVHGGLSPDLTSMEDITKLNRFQEVPEDGLFCDLLWSDPLTVDNGTPESELADWAMVRYKWNTRGCGYVFGLRAVRDFLSANNFKSVIRAHEVQKDGFYKHLFGYEQYGHSLPPGDKEVPVITVFSAPNYCGIYTNKAGYLRVNEAGTIEYNQIDAVEAPYVLPRHMNAFQYSIPTVTENLMKATAFLCSLLIGDTQNADETDLSILAKIRKMQEASTILKLHRERIDLVPHKLGFELARQEDGENEKKPLVTITKKRAILARTNSCRF